MVPFTRRALLHSACGLATLFAGCSRLFEGGTGSTRTPTERNDAAGPRAGSVADPDTVVARVDADRKPVWLDDERPTESRRRDRLQSEVIDTAANADRLGIAETVDREPIESFLAETDFETETIYLQNVNIEECFRLSLCRVQWSPDRISTDYGRVSRPYDERCTAGETVYAAWFIRIPQALDADEVTTFSSSIGGSGCDGPQMGAESEGVGGSGQSSVGPVVSEHD
ncbi:hypothetical protein ACOZ4F_03435 [Haloarcula marismortui]|uniref:hypothetical protein n=1 Tax=Haloarcula marismortui TaxID=2238 RepID=UPI003C714E36